MPEFPWLRNGDKLPAVAVAQLLLKRDGANLSIDGDYGSRTKAATVAFQQPRGLGHDGVIGRNTWPRLKNQESLQILDCIDIFDPDLFTSENAHITGTGGSPVVLGGMCNGIEQAVRMIRGAASNLFLLRFHGHGAPGAAGVSDGHGEDSDHSSFENNRATRDALAQLRDCFGRYGCIQFMHCETGAGAAGARFLRMVADTVGVPATAAHRTQYAGSVRETLRFEGPTRTVCPGGGTLTSWARSLPEFVGMSVV